MTFATFCRLCPLKQRRRTARRRGRRKRPAGPDLRYHWAAKALLFRFIEVKYRRHLRAARSPEVLENLRRQVESLQTSWNEWYDSNDVPSAFRAIRRAKLARVLRFYADKAHRHYLPDELYATFVAEIDRMIEKGGDYSFSTIDNGNRGWVFCPEYAGANPLEITPGGWETRIFLFGPGPLPDSAFRRESIGLLPPSRPQLPDESDAATSAAETLPEDTSASEGTAVPTAAGEGIDEPTGRSEQPEPRPDNANHGSMPPSVCLGTDTLTGAEVRWPLTVRGNPHLLVAGLPGMGKTTCLLNLCRQMLDAEIRPIVFSYHQDIDEQLESWLNQFDSSNFMAWRLIRSRLSTASRGWRISMLPAPCAISSWPFSRSLVTFKGSEFAGRSRRASSRTAGMIPTPVWESCWSHLLRGLWKSYARTRSRTAA